MWESAVTGRKERCHRRINDPWARVPGPGGSTVAELRGIEGAGKLAALSVSACAALRQPRRAMADRGFGIVAKDCRCAAMGGHSARAATVEVRGGHGHTAVGEGPYVHRRQRRA
jgi:hypothetical protein